ncbi:PadR family transcriptional regulator [Actinoallomurus iriomotensis]|uniref:PadR family transcriptional regulator n=1 Tax=Actinoallomurus iriomotensis TaxID=478107 RepID=A0A9W6VW04_9ACTN|nr:PadR family transcriptional regulator [Actinoallomurus iriomotensis]GLY81112.1 PadR family transcriptional regulator [Actinoallomurus iriomotensis]
MSIGHVLLGLLTERPKHGYELKREHDDRFPGVKPIAYGQVYATLQRLERDGKVAVSGTAKEGGPERVVYEITSVGTDEVRRWLAEIEPPAPYVSSALSTRVVLALIVGGTADGYLLRQRAAHLERMRELTARKNTAGISAGELLATDYALHHLDADLRWLETARQRIGELTKEIRP